jgi:dUTP pyrophosphatase
MSVSESTVSQSELVRYRLYIVVEDKAMGLPPTEGGEKEYNFTYSLRDNLNAGFDLVTAEDWSGSDVHLLDLGVRAMMVRKDTGQPVHFWLAPRSSIYKTGYMMANSLGVIDASYRGVLKAPVVRVGGEGAKGLKRGERHFQICAPDLGWIEEIQRVGSLPETARGDGGFGSTGV